MVVEEFYKRFANGEQYLLFKNGNIIEQEKQFYWQERKVYNRILPTIEILKAKYGDLVTDDLLYKEDGFVSRMVPVQRAYNALMNRQMEMVNRIGANTLIVEDGSVDIDCLEEEGLGVGKILVYRQGAEQPKMPFRITQKEVKLLENERIFLLDEFYQHTLAFESHLQVLKDKE